VETITTEDRDGIRLVTLDRPDALNAFSTLLMDELAEAFIDAAEDDTVRVLVMTGAGRAFSAGADLSEDRAAREPRHGLAGMLDAIVDFPKPFLLAVNGLGVGIGCTICGLADCTYIAEGARLRAPFSALGLTAEAASTVTFPALMGRQRANWVLLGAEWMSAEEAVTAGLAMEIHPQDALLDHVMEQATKLAKLPMASLLKTKSLIMAPLRETMKAAIAAENVGLDELRGQPANLEAVTAFREKRDPDFTGL
jgi:enoyl-CoA hydratase/carnithine racemase